MTQEFRAQHGSDKATIAHTLKQECWTKKRSQKQVMGESAVTTTQHGMHNMSLASSTSQGQYPAHLGFQTLEGARFLQI